jgi:hypothetical protein
VLSEQVPETCIVRVVLNGVHADSYDFHEYYGYRWNETRPRVRRVQ